jgi:hypothetical protein
MCRSCETTLPWYGASPACPVVAAAPAAVAVVAAMSPPLRTTPVAATAATGLWISFPSTDIGYPPYVVVSVVEKVKPRNRSFG